MLAAKDSRLLLVEEPVRRGKAAAINQIIDRVRGRFLVFVNSDATPDRGAISKLLLDIASREKIGVVSASPYFQSAETAVSELTELMWTLHNGCSLTLNHLGISNHASDELMVVNTDVLERLPERLVNDGAYIAGASFLKGYAIRFSESARVKIDVPSRLSDLIQQRRRILFGHIQVWRWLGQPPRTVELMLLSAPRLSLTLAVQKVSRTWRLLRILPIAAVAEAIAFLFAVKDQLASSNQHVVWRRYGE